MARLLQAVVQLGLVVDGIDQLGAEGCDFLAQVGMHGGIGGIVARDCWLWRSRPRVRDGVERLAVGALQHGMDELFEMGRGQGFGDGFICRGAQRPHLRVEAGGRDGARAGSRVDPRGNVDEPNKAMCERCAGYEAATTAMRVYMVRRKTQSVITEVVGQRTRP